VESSAARRAPIVQLADRLSGYFVAVVLILAVLTFFIGLRREPATAPCDHDAGELPHRAPRLLVRHYLPTASGMSIL
jgi:cation transport ATPase